MKFGDYIRQKREARGWTQPEAAARADIEQSYLSKLETGKSYPSEDVFSRLVETYDIDVDELGEDVLASDLVGLKEIRAVRQALMRQEKRSKGATRSWLVAGIAGLVAGGAALGVALTAEDEEYEVYYYRSAGVLESNEDLNAFDIVNDSFDASVSAHQPYIERQQAMLERLDEADLPLRTYRGNAWVQDTPEGRRYFRMMESEIVAERSPLRWFFIPGLALILGSFGCFFATFRWR